MTSRALAQMISKATQVTLAAFLGLFAVCGYGAEDKPQAGVLPLEGLWKFARDKEGKGDSGGFAKPGFDDRSWEEIRIPGAYNHQGHAGYLGVVWYRREITVPASWKGQPVSLQLPPVDDWDETYWNGVKIGSMGKKQFTNPRLYRVPEANIRWGEPNLIAVKVTNAYMGGGFTTVAPARLISRGPFTELAPADPAPLGEDEITLGATRGVAGKPGKNWTPGWRDEGTADTRPKLHARTGPQPGTEALGFEITHPNASGEFVDYNLQPQELGSIWQLRDYDYIAFDYQTGDTEGEMRLYLNAGGWKWGRGKSGFGTIFPVRKGGWTRVVLPLEEFHDVQPRITTFLPDTNLVKALTLGYRNNEMRSPGEVKFANFRVGRFPGKAPEKIDLDGMWHLGRDGGGEAAPKGDFRAWPTVVAGFPWAGQGLKENEGVFWLKQDVLIPKHWQDTQLRLRLGELRSRQDLAEVYFNDVKVGTTTDHDTQLDVSIPAGLVKAGEKNTLAVRLRFKNSNSAGLFRGPFEIRPQPVWVAMRAAGTGKEPVISTEFDAGPVVGGERYELFLRVPKHHVPEGENKVDYRITDCFHRVVKEGEGSLQTAQGKNYLELPVELNGEESSQLYFSEYFDVKILLKNAKGDPLYAGTQLKAGMKYDSRDAYVREPLPETWEETPYGKLKLIDEIDAGEEPGGAGHVYKEGGYRESWVGRRAYSSWVDGVTIKELAGRKYREANNYEWFGYRVGRGRIEPGKAYLVRMEYPEDKTRYAPMNIDAGRNYQGLGFRTGVGKNNTFDDYPISGTFGAYDVVVIPDEKTYGSGGTRSVPADKGFWIFFYDNGRSYTPQYEAGPAVAKIKVYEMPEGDAAYPKIRYPEQAPRRFFVADWEREPEWIAADMVRHARILGYNAISPSILKWGSLAFWHVENTGTLKLRPVRPVREDLPPEETSALEKFLAASKEAGMTIFPRLEYGGSEGLPQSAKAIGPNGKLARPSRFHTWCANLLDPAVFAEFSEILKQTVGDRLKENPQIGGILFRIRSDRLPISYGPGDVALFAKETGASLPEGFDDAALAKWANEPVRAAKYVEWWHAKRRDFHAKIVEQLKSYRPDLKMLYYNWDPDNWDLGKIAMTPEDYRDQYNMHTSLNFYKRKEASQRAMKDEDYIALIRDKPAPHNQVRPELYADLAKNFALLGPVNWHYTADNPSYLNAFRTGDQLALTKIFNYEEKSRWNVQGDRYEASEMSTAGPAFAMAEQVLSCFHGDPWILTETTYTYGQGFVEQHREFAQAFLSLPALPGKVIETPGVSNAENLKVRRYGEGDRVHLSVAHKGYSPETSSLELPGPWPASVTVTDQVSGAKIPAEIKEGKLCLDLSLPPMVLKSFLVEPAPKS